MPSPIAEALDHAKKSGAKAAEALLSQAKGVTLELERGKPTAPEPHSDARLTVRLWVDGGGEGFAQGPPEDATTLVDAALKKAKIAWGDSLAGPVGKLGLAEAARGIDDRRHEQITTADRQEALVSAEKGARDKRIRASGFTYRDERRWRGYGNSRGVALQEWSTTYAMAGTIELSDDRGTLTLEDQPASRAFASIASLPYGAALAARALALAPTGPTLSGPIRVVLSARTAAELVTRLAPAFANLARDEGWLAAAHRDDRRAFDPRVNLLDDGTLHGALRTHAFDDRGVTPIPVALMSDGRVPAGLIDLLEARHRKLRPTGHWFDGALRSNNLILRGGTRSANAILSELDGPVLIVDHVYDWAGMNATTGDVRIPVGGALTRRAKREGAVRRVVLHGNLADVLSRVVEVASDTDRFGYVDACGLIVDGFTAVG